MGIKKQRFNIVFVVVSNRSTFKERKKTFTCCYLPHFDTKTLDPDT